MIASAESRMRRPDRGLRLPLEFRLALRDLRGGLGGFTVFLICIALGTGAIGTINSLSGSIQNSISRQGKELLGGDVEATLVHRQADDRERAYFASMGEVSEIATMRAMARKPDGSTQALVDLKAVDGSYPLYGTAAFEEGQSIGSIHQGGGVAVDRSLLDQLQIGPGDTIAIGRAALPVTAVIEHEPDRLAAGPAIGARVLLSLDTLKKTGLAGPGSLVRWSYRIKTREPVPASFKEDSCRGIPRSGLPLARQFGPIARCAQYAGAPRGISYTDRADGHVDGGDRRRKRGGRVCRAPADDDSDL